MLGQTIEVGRYKQAQKDPFNNTEEHAGALEWERVSNVLYSPYSTADEIKENAPARDQSALVFHFPKTYEKSLAGAILRVRGATYAVDGDPQPFMADLCPGTWNREVVARLVQI